MLDHNYKGQAANLPLQKKRGKRIGITKRTALLPIFRIVQLFPSF